MEKENVAVSEDDASKSGSVDWGRLFGSLIRFPIETVFTILNAGDDHADSASLWRLWANVGLAPIHNRVRLVLEDAVGFDLTKDIAYPLGEIHPELKRPGQSMLDAFSGFEAILRAQYGEVTELDHPLGSNPDRNMVTFGSPNSNVWARQALGYNPVDEHGHELRVASGFGIEAPIKYGVSGEGLIVDRLRYKEPRWNLATPDGVLTPRLRDNGMLENDFLVLTSTPNTESARTARTLDARLRLREKSPLSPADRHALEKDAEGPIDRLLIVGGLHGPGTAAAKLLMNDVRSVQRLAHAIRDAGALGGFWQAVIHVSVAIDLRAARDSPSALDDFRAYPIDVP